MLGGMTPWSQVLPERRTLGVPLRAPRWVMSLRPAAGRAAKIVDASPLTLSNLPSMFKIFATGLLMAAIPLVSQATEEPDYHVVRELAGAEIRQYAPYVVAQVLVDGPAESAGNQAFPILTGYIFGKNKGERKFAMTAPVTQTAVPVKMEMTAPVLQEAAAGGFMVQFVLPKGVTLESAPEPLDARVQLRQVTGQRVAVLRYSGTWSQSNYDQHLAQLQAALQLAQITWTGQPVLSRYDAPFTPWFLRRNEIWLTVPAP